MIASDDPRHGTNAGHIAGCRQQCCNRAKLQYDKRRKHELATTGLYRQVDATGFRRRVHALQAIGWSMSRISAQLGICVGTLSNRMAEGDKVYRTSHEQMVTVYDRLSMVTPTGPYVARVKQIAALNSWAPPLAWDDATIDNPDAQPNYGQQSRDVVDEILVQRALSGQKVKANRAEKALIVKRWKVAGRPINELNRLQGWNTHRDERAAG